MKSILSNLCRYKQIPSRWKGQKKSYEIRSSEGKPTQLQLRRTEGRYEIPFS